MLLILLGFVILIMGANWLVNGSSALARKYNVSELAIGLTIVAFGTSAPELIVNIIASSKNYSDIAIGNIVGSNNFNLFFILGVSALIFPISVKSSTAWREIPFSLITTIIFFLLVTDFFMKAKPVLSRIDGGIMFSTFLFFLYYLYKNMKNESIGGAVAQNKSVTYILLLILLSLSLLIIGGHIVVDKSVELAARLGVSDKVISLTIVAAGTSLPELLTSIVASVKRNSDIAIGNVIGSNIFNILLILSVSSFIKPIPFNKNFNSDIILLSAGTLFLLIAMTTGTRKKIDRWEAALLLACYLAYTVFILYKTR